MSDPSPKRKSPEENSTSEETPPMKRQKTNNTQKRKGKNSSRKIKNTFGQDIENLDSLLFKGYYDRIKHLIFSKTVETDENHHVTIVQHDDVDEEMNRMLTSFKEELPITFRINPVKDARAQHIKSRLEKLGDWIDEKKISKSAFYKDMDDKRLEHLNKQMDRLKQKGESKWTETDKEAMQSYQESIDTIKKRTYSDALVPRPTPIPWYPDGLGYYMPISKKFLAKNKELSELKKFILPQTENGNISRQEMVSMLPTQFFDYQPHHKMLDMCAAPGSKTSQLLEGLHNSAKAQNKPVTGFVVANDNNVKRCHLLVKQLQRLGPLFSNMIITSHDATKYPALESKGKKIQFDNILCDVMCSGDGTLRKSADLWNQWTPRLGPALHEMQISVTMRAFRLLAPGGRIVYSTCSINPIEDEAVVAEILRRSKGGLRLVNCAGRLKNFKYSPGISDWTLCKKNGEPESRDNASEHGKVRESMFPPTKEEAEWMNLDFTMRILPHLQDSGGFFVAVFESTERKSEEKQEQETKKDEVIIRHAHGGLGDLQFNNIDEQFHEELMKFYSLDRNIFPPGTLFNRKDLQNDNARGDVPKRIFYAPECVRRVLTFNHEAGTPWKVINAGLRIFEHAKRIVGHTRHLTPEQYRICQESVDILYDQIESRRLMMPYRVFKHILKSRELIPNDLKETLEKDPKATDDDKKHVEMLEKFSCGPCIVVDKDGLCPVAAHRTPYSLQLYCKKELQTALVQNLDTILDASD